MIIIKDKTIYDTDKSVEIFSLKNVEDKGRYNHYFYYKTINKNFFQIIKQVIIPNGLEHTSLDVLNEEELCKIFERLGVGIEVYKKAGINLKEG